MENRLPKPPTFWEINKPISKGDYVSLFCAVFLAVIGIVRLVLGDLNGLLVVMLGLFQGMVYLEHKLNQNILKGWQQTLDEYKEVISFVNSITNLTNSVRQRRPQKEIRS